jgi:hypothetical protein
MHKGLREFVLFLINNGSGILDGFMPLKFGQDFMWEYMCNRMLASLTID